jgi:hypothetical protein
VLAPAEELDAMTEHLEAAARRDRAIERVVDRLLQVEDPMAPDAGEMMMLRHVAVEPTSSRAAPLDDEPRLDQETQVPVDRPQAHARQPAPHGPEDPLGRRVQLRGAHAFEDDAARAGGAEAPAQR